VRLIVRRGRVFAVAIAVAVAALAAAPVAAAEDTGGGAEPVQAQDQEQLPDLGVSATFDRAAYHSGDLVGVSVVVTNNGPAPATEVRAHSAGDVFFQPQQWGALSDLGPGARIDPGQSVSVELSDRLTLADGVIDLEIRVQAAQSDANPGDNWIGITAPVTATTGDYVGVVYGDRNRNGSLDAGEALRGVTVTLQGGVPLSHFEQTTDSAGRFSFRDIPAGQYGRYMILPAGWQPPVDYQVTVHEDDPEVLVQATRPLTETLSASVRFAEDTYAAGQEAHLTVTLTNSGPAPLSGITALCTGAGVGEIHNEYPGWGPLSYMVGTGVTIQAGETRTFEVTSVIPDLAFVYGRTFANCLFGSPPERDGNPMANDTARVPGGIGTSGGVLIHDRNGDGDYAGDGLAGATIRLLDRYTGALVASSTTDASGRFLFASLPADTYELRVIGPWKLDNPNDAFFPIRHQRDERRYQILVVPGADQPDPAVPPVEQPAPSAPAPAPAASPVPPALAATGPGVIETSTTGLALLLVGFGLLVAGRRRVVVPAGPDALSPGTGQCLRTDLAGGRGRGVR
jgi:SdrD B-like domain